MKVLGSVVASTEKTAIKAAIKVFQVERIPQDHIIVTRIDGEDD